MAKNGKRWSKRIEEAGLRANLYERDNSSVLWYSITDALTKVTLRKSTKRKTRKEAEDYVRALLRTMAQRGTAEVFNGNPTLAEVFKGYDAHKAPTLSEDWRKAAETRRDLFLEAWGGRQPVRDISQTHVDRYCAARRAGKLTPLGKGGPGDREPVKVRDGTLDADFRWLSSVFNWARKHKVGGQRLLRENPLHDVEWPREKNPRRPVASQGRYTATQEHTDDVDPKGRLRCILALARFTGRRESAVCALRASDLLLTEAAVRERLASSGLDEATRDENGDELYPDGAVYWSPESDKQGLLHITALSPDARREVDRYRGKSARVGDVPLFPADEDPSEPVRRDVAARWLLKAEKAAKLPKLKGGVFHPYRRLWATERQHLSDVAVASAGGWSDTRALKMSYQQATPADVLKAVRGA